MNFNLFVFWLEMSKIEDFLVCVDCGYVKFKYLCILFLYCFFLLFFFKYLILIFLDFWIFVVFIWLLFLNSVLGNDEICCCFERFFIMELKGDVLFFWKLKLNVWVFGDMVGELNFWGCLWKVKCCGFFFIGFLIEFFLLFFWIFDCFEFFKMFFIVFLLVDCVFDREFLLLLFDIFLFFEFVLGSCIFLIVLENC